MKDLLLALGSKPGSEPAKKPALDVEVDAGPSEGMDEDTMGYDAVASEVMGALKAGDAAGFAEALKSFIELCK